MKSLFATLVFALLLQDIQAQQQGIHGIVTWSAGNQMPGPDQKSASAKGISRKIYIYEVTVQNQVVQEDGFFKRIDTKLIKVGKSRRNGRFRIKLPSGLYSVFVEESKGLWANLFNGEGQINPVEVKNGVWTTFPININYMAAY